MVSDMNDGRSKRKIRNYLIEPEIQFKRAYYFVAFFVCMLAGIVFWAYLQLIVAVEFLSAEYSMIAIHFTDLLKSVSGFTIAGYITTGIVSSIIFGIYSSHRVIGPSVAIRHHLERLKKGDFSQKLTIRKGDELVTVVKHLNELTDVLRQKNNK